MKRLPLKVARNTATLGSELWREWDDIKMNAQEIRSKKNYFRKTEMMRGIRSRNLMG